MILTGLVQAKLEKRYKRFLADVKLQDGTVVTAHCANPGSMLGMSDPGMTVYLSHCPAPSRKLAWSMKLVQTPTSLVVVDTLLANKLFKEAFTSGTLTEFANFDKIESEQVFADSRFDFRLSKSTQANLSHCFVEVKSTTLWQNGQALFPDSRTERGRKHLATLSMAVAGGYAATQFYLIGRSDAQSFSSADAIDPLYGQALRAAQQAGVGIVARALHFEHLDFDAEKIAAGLNFDLSLTVAHAVPIELN